MMITYFYLGIIGMIAGFLIMLFDDFNPKGVIAFLLSLAVVIYAALRIWF